MTDIGAFAPFPDIVTLCGSMRFFDQMLEVAGELTLNGEIVLAPFVHIPSDEQAANEDKTRLDRLHFDKIDLSKSIFVVNPGGYVGESTQREIEHARSRGKVVRSLEPLGATRNTRGACSRCGAPRKIRADGTVPRHYPYDGGDVFMSGEPYCPDHADCEHIVCPGSLKPPNWRAF